MNADDPGSGRVLFPETAWTRVLAGRSGDAEGTSRALEDLCRQYWPAIYSYVRALGLAKAEAEDAVQDFVKHFMLGGAAAAGGSGARKAAILHEAKHPALFGEAAAR